MGILNTLKKILHIGAVVVDDGLNKLISVELQLKAVEKDTIDALDKQAQNAVKLNAAKIEFDRNYDKAKQELTRMKTSCEVLKNNLVKQGKNPNEDEDMQLAAATYVEQKKLVDEMANQKESMDTMIKRVDKILKHLKLNKSVINMKATMLRQKITMYQNQALISESGMIDINNTFSEIDGIVQKMQDEQQAAQRVDAIVNGRDTAQVANDADVMNFIDSLS
jgi:hypothetical protein